MGNQIQVEFSPIYDPHGLIEGTPASEAKRSMRMRRERGAAIARLEAVGQRVRSGEYPDDDDFYRAVARDFDSLGPYSLELEGGLEAGAAVARKLDEFYGDFTADVLDIMSPKQRAALDRDLGVAIVKALGAVEIEKDTNNA